MPLKIPAIPRSSADSEPTTFLVVGAESDLVRKLVLDGIEGLRSNGRGRKARFVFSGRGEKFDSTNNFRRYASEVLAEGDTRTQDRSALLEQMFYTSCEDTNSPEEVARLVSTENLNNVGDNLGDQRMVMHTALSADYWVPLLKNLPELPRLDQALLEKPIGANLGEAKDIITAIQGTPNADKYRAIDHYLAKDMVDYLQKLRRREFKLSEEEESWADFLDTILDPTMWDSVKLLMEEKQQLTDRVTFFDRYGLMADMFQSHALLVLASTLGNKDLGFDESVDDFLSNIGNLEINKTGQYRGYTDHPKATNESRMTHTAFQASFHLRAGEARIPVENTLAKGVSKKRGIITVTFSEEGLQTPDDCFVDELAIHFHDREIKLRGRKQKGEAYEKTIELIPDTYQHLPAYGRIYADAITGGHHTGTIALNTVEKAWTICETAATTEAKPCLYTAGSRFS